MDQQNAPGASGSPLYWTTPPAKPAPKHPRGLRVLVGAVISFVVASLLYGPSNVLAMVAMATICTAGIGGLLILVGCWAVGWVAVEVWDATQGSTKAPSGA
ncbi:MAG TPA: hypothetical protein VJ506_02540 [Candidatus Limnocylindrales bacterium]|nr:hypothetical protein [Candidatus Limnocylindrales bacterium]